MASKTLKLSKKFVLPPYVIRKGDSELLMDHIMSDIDAFTNHLTRCLRGKVKVTRNGDIVWNRKTSNGHIHLTLHEGGFDMNESGALHVKYDSVGLNLVFRISIHKNSSGNPSAKIDVQNLYRITDVGEYNQVDGVLRDIKTCLNRYMNTITLGGKTSRRYKTRKSRNARKRL
jgi:hypothetical protein